MDFMDIGFLEFLIILILVLIVFGPRQMVETARMLGKYARKFRLLTAELSRQVNEELSRETSGLTDEFNELGNGITGEIKNVIGNFEKGIDTSPDSRQRSDKDKQIKEESETQDG